MTNSNATERKKTLIVPLIIAGMLFFVIGFGVGIGGFLGEFLQNAFKLTETEKYLVMAATFSAFVLFGAPAGWVIKRTGYKKALIIALFLMAVGWLLYLPSASSMSFPLFLFALFVGGIGNTLLQAAVNPYVTIIGPMESATMRMCLMGIMNKSAWWLGSLFLGIFMSVANAQMKDIPLPALLTAGTLVVFAIALIFIKLPEVKAVGEDEPVDSKEVFESTGKTSIFQFPHLILGAIALFLYVGVETLPIATMIGYVKSTFGAGVASPEKYVVFITIGLVIGYLFGVFMIPKAISQTSALKLFTSLAIVSSLILIFLPDSVSKYGIYCLAALGTFHSVMWGAIWALAIDGLGKFTKTGSSILVMGIVGGAIIPLLFGFILDSLKAGAEMASVGQYQKAYWIFVPAYLYILYFGIAGHKVGRAAALKGK